MTNNNSVKITLIIVSAVVVLALLGFFYTSQFAPATNTVSAQGVAEIKAVPDLVTVYFSVQTKGNDAKEAKDKNSEIVDKAITNLVKLGFERKDIITENFNVYPEYDWVNGQRIDKGYSATHSLKVQISTDKMEMIGDAIDAGVDAGAGISYINFELSMEKQNQYKAEALEAATLDAKTKAEAIASGLGKSLGRIVSVSTSDFGYSPWNIYYGAEMASAADAKLATTSIQPGQQTVTARVSVLYRI